MKPAVTNIQEFKVIELGVRLFERASGCEIHRDISNNKCKILLMGNWKFWSQENIPLPFLSKSDFIDMLGVRLYSSYTKTRQVNGELMVKEVNNTIRKWKSGKFVPFTSRPISVNTYILSKLWYKTSAIDFRIGDEEKIVSSLKSWIYQDCFLKPEEEILYRRTQCGGLGLHNIAAKGTANLTVSFIQSAISPNFVRNLYHEALYNYFILGIGTKCPNRPPYYSENFFKNIKIAIAEGMDVFSMSTKDWYSRFVQRNITHQYNTMTDCWELKPSKIEYYSPHIDHINSYLIMRKINLPTKMISTLFKMKNDLFLTEERKYHCHLVNSNRCTFCMRTDYIGHFLICEHSPINKICKSTIDIFNKVFPKMSLERMIHIDMEGELDEIFAWCWIVSLIADFIYVQKKSCNLDFDLQLRGIFQSNLSTLSNIINVHPRYEKTYNYITNIVESCNI